VWLAADARFNYIGNALANAFCFQLTCGHLKKPDRLQHKLFQGSKSNKLAMFRAIDDC